MLIPIGRQYLATSFASTLRHVTCERCGTPYQYELRRTGRGNGFSPLFLANLDASANAANRAARNLAQRLARECDSVPCPSCNHLQEHMAVAAKRARAKTCILAAAPILVILASFAFVGNNLPPKQQFDTIWLYILMAVDTAILFLLVATMPAHIPVPTNVPPQTLPPEDFTGRGPQDDFDLPVPQTATPTTPPPCPQSQPSTHLLEDYPDAWIPIRPSVLAFPPNCCACHAPTESTFPASIARLEVRLPLCPARTSTIQSRQTLLGCLIFVGLAIPFFLLFLTIPNTPLAGPIFGSATLAAMITYIVNAAFLRFTGLPIRVRNAIPDHDFAELQFTNSALTQSFLQHKLLLESSCVR